MYICIDCRAASRPRSGAGTVSDSETKSSSSSLRKLSGSCAFHASQVWRVVRRLSCCLHHRAGRQGPRHDDRSLDEVIRLGAGARPSVRLDLRSAVPH